MTDPTDFDALYRRDPDPFSVRTSWYERRKLALVLATLAQARYLRVWDPACGTGDLALALSARCGHVLASDLSARAVELSAELLAGAPNVLVAIHRLPAAPPDPPYDLLAVTEVLYYLPDQDRLACYRMLAAASGAGAELVTVHWRHLPHDAYLSGEAVTRELGDALTDLGWQPRSRTDDPDFVLASWVRPTATSAN